MQFTAKIGLNLRDVATSKPLVLLTDIQTDDIDFRSHCHVDINKTLNHFLRRKVRHNRNRLIISFEADILKYYKPRENTYAETLTNVRNIKILGKA